ncbi:MAG: glycosyl hydrolase-related protein [Mangrovibacterium sp.]
MRKRNYFMILFVFLCFLGDPLDLASQAGSSHVEFLNVPVLFKEGDKSFQQMAGTYKSEVPGEIVVTANNRELLKAGKNEFSEPLSETLRIDAPANAMLINSRPSWNKKGTVLLHFRETDGQGAEVKISSAIPEHPIKRMTEVNATGTRSGQTMTSVSLKPYEVKFIELEF